MPADAQFGPDSPWTSEWNRACWHPRWALGAAGNGTSQRPGRRSRLCAVASAWRLLPCPHEHECGTCMTFCECRVKKHRSHGENGQNSPSWVVTRSCGPPHCLACARCHGCVLGKVSSTPRSTYVLCSTFLLKQFKTCISRLQFSAHNAFFFIKNGHPGNESKQAQC